MDLRKIKTDLRDNKKIFRCAEQFWKLGDINRLKICWLLCKYRELSVGEIADILNLSLSAVSHSLKKLKNLGMVKSRKQNRNVYYCICRHPLVSYIRKNLTYTSKK